MMKRHWAMPTPQYKSKPTIASPIPRNTRQSWQTVTTVGCIYSWTRKAKRHVLGCQKWLVLPPNIWSLTAVKPTCCAIGNLMFLISALPLIFHFSHLLGIFLAQKQHTPLEIVVNIEKLWLRIFCWTKNNQVDNSRLSQTSNVWRQNTSYLHPIRTCSLLTCTRLDATDGIIRTHDGVVTIKLA